MVLVLLHFKERQSHQQAEEISGLADGTSTRTELRITPRPHTSGAEGIRTSARVGERGALPELQSAKEWVKCSD
jgi:hypothetical protein